MKILISPVTSVPVSKHAINDLRRAGAQFRVQRVDHKIAFIAPITWAGMSDTKWVLSALINDDEKTVLLRAETQDDIPENKRREVTQTLKRLNRRDLEGQFSLDDAFNSVMYYVGPFPYDERNGVLWHAVERVANAIRQASSVTDMLQR